MRSFLLTPVFFLSFLQVFSAVDAMDRNNAVKLFVGNLALDTSQEDLMALFGPYGQVVGCSVLRQFAFVHLQGDGASDRAIRELNGLEFKGRNLVVEESRGRPLNSTKVFVGNLSALCSAEDLQELFQTFGKVIECDKVKGKLMSEWYSTQPQYLKIGHQKHGVLRIV